MKNSKANLLIALGLLLPYAVKRKGGRNKPKAIPVKIAPTPLPKNLPDQIATPDRWLARLPLPKEQKLVMQKALRELPTTRSSKGKERLTAQSVQNLFAKGLPYSTKILSSNVGSLINVEPFIKEIENAKPFLLEPATMDALSRGRFKRLMEIGRQRFFHNLSGLAVEETEELVRTLQFRRLNQTRPQNIPISPTFQHDLSSYFFSLNSMLTKITAPNRDLFDPVTYFSGITLPESIRYPLAQLNMSEIGFNVDTMTFDNLEDIRENLELGGSCAPFGAQINDVIENLGKQKFVLPLFHQIINPKVLQLLIDLPSKLLKYAQTLEINTAQDPPMYATYGLSTIVQAQKTDKEIEGLVIPDIGQLFKKDSRTNMFDFMGFGMHYTRNAGRLNPLFWFRGLIKSDILYVQEFQNDMASRFRKKYKKDQLMDDDYESGRATLEKMKEQGVPFPDRNKTKYRFDMTNDEAFYYSYNYPTEEEHLEMLADELGLNISEEQFNKRKDQLLADYPHELEKDYEVNNYGPLRFLLPPTNWLRSDIIFAFATAACQGINKVAFCDSTASLATVGGVKKGQDAFYNVMVPNQVRSIAKKYGIKRIGTTQLPLKKEIYVNMAKDELVTPDQYMEKHIAEGLIKPIKTINCHVWEIPPKTMEYFRTVGFPLFG
jgi:hypothetical protein